MGLFSAIDGSTILGMNTKRNRLSRWNQTNVICHCCGKRTTDQSGEGTDLCGVCFESAGMENQHMDTNGEHYGEKPSDCPYCLGLQCMHEKAKKVRKPSLIDAINQPENAAKLNQAINEVVASATAKLALDASGRRHGAGGRFVKKS